MSDSTKPALPEPDGYFYEVDGYFGIHRQFDTAPYNGMRPHRTVGYFTADTTRAAIDAAVAEARAVSDWRPEAAKWLRLKAAEQAVTNAKYPAHAESYPSWRKRVLDLGWLADELEKAATTLSPAEQPKPAVRDDDAKDAARYRWMRQRYPALTCMATAQGLGLDLSCMYVDSADKFDAVIDAALQGEPHDQA